MARQHRPCSYEGCRAWAKMGEIWCVAHPNGQPRMPEGWPVPGYRKARKRGLKSGYVPVVGLKEALALPPGDLRLEIAVVRQVLAQLLSSKVPPVELVGAVDRATGALVRMLKVNKVLSSEVDGELEAGVERYLRELGLGGG